ncbi:MAG: ABC transporter permease [Proteobacteria bacterium]|nr:ABC transporter permease [Pseudomonadota bacterium]
MEVLFKAVKNALFLLFTFDRDVYEIIFLTIKVCLTSTIISAVLGITTAYLVSVKKTRQSSLLITSINTGMAIPPVLAGLIITVIFWRSGIFGHFEILYTPLAMIIAQVLIAYPVVTAISLSAINSLPEKFIIQMIGLGANKIQLFFVVIRELKGQIFCAIVAGFGSVISEVGASMMVGGNIKGYTRVITTATVTETSRGNLELAFAYGIILLLMTFVINLLFVRFQQRKK